jgi:lipoprotein-anchoring transpeptidase ErfK/SrfK
MAMKQIILLGTLLLFLIGVGFLIKPQAKQTVVDQPKESHWFVLHRKANREYFYYGVAGDKEKSKLLKTFVVKSGIPAERPTPLPKLVGREYWVITGKEEQKDNPETAPYFLTLNIPVGEEEPFGPTPYLECNGQCNWILPGYFGLHGSGGDPAKLATENPGSSGCIRHTDEDITYLFNTLEPEKEEIRYYIKDI